MEIDESRFPQILGAQIVADDGTFLGTISNSRYDGNSIFNGYGSYGSRFSRTSIFNQFGTYGGPYSTQSPYNPYTSRPPKIIKAGRTFGHLTVNPYLSGDRVNPHALVAWLRTR